MIFRFAQISFAGFGFHAVKTFKGTVYVVSVTGVLKYALASSFQLTGIIGKIFEDLTDRFSNNIEKRE